MGKAIRRTDGQTSFPAGPQEAIRAAQAPGESPLGKGRSRAQKAAFASVSRFGRGSPAFQGPVFRLTPPPSFHVGLKATT